VAQLRESGLIVAGAPAVVARARPQVDTRQAILVASVGRFRDADRFNIQCDQPSPQSDLGREGSSGGAFFVPLQYLP
jgi:hypothetical protein